MHTCEIYFQLLGPTPSPSLSEGFPVKSAEYPGWQMQLHLELVKLLLAICPTDEEEGASF